MVWGRGGWMCTEGPGEQEWYVMPHSGQHAQETGASGQNPGTTHIRLACGQSQPGGLGCVMLTSLPCLKLPSALPCSL